MQDLGTMAGVTMGALLRVRGADTIVMAGTRTNVCCESSARDAMMLDYSVTMVSDACATTTREEHDAALAAFYATFGDVMDTRFILDRLPMRAAVE